MNQTIGDEKQTCLFKKAAMGHLKAKSRHSFRILKEFWRMSEKTNHTTWLLLTSLKKKQLDALRGQWKIHCFSKSSSPKIQPKSHQNYGLRFDQTKAGPLKTRATLQSSDQLPAPGRRLFRAVWHFGPTPQGGGGVRLQCFEGSFGRLQVFAQCVDSQEPRKKRFEREPKMDQIYAEASFPFVAPCGARNMAVESWSNSL